MANTGFLASRLILFIMVVILFVLCLGVWSFLCCWRLMCVVPFHIIYKTVYTVASGGIPLSASF